MFQFPNVSRCGQVLAVTAIFAFLQSPMLLIADPPPRTIHGQDSRQNDSEATPATEGKKLYLHEELRLEDRRGAEHVLFTPDGSMLLRFSESELSFWDLTGADPKEITVVNSRNLGLRQITAAAFSPDGSLLALGSRDKSVRLFSYDHTGTLTELSSATEHDAAVFSLQFNARGNLLASGGDDQCVFLWTVASGKLNKVGIIKIERAMFGIKHIAFMPGKPTMVITVGDGTVCVLNISDNRITEQSTRKMPSIFDLPLAVSPKGDSMVFGSRQDIRIWDRSGDSAFAKHQGTVTAVAWSADGRVFASAGEDGRVVVWSPGGKVRYEMLRPKKFTGLAFSPVDIKGGDLQLACANENGTVYLLKLSEIPAPGAAPAVPNQPGNGPRNPTAFPAVDLISGNSHEDQHGV